MLKAPKTAALGILGFAERRAIRTRSMTRAEWRGLTQRLRAASRNAGNPAAGAFAERCRELILELQRITGCDIGRWTHPGLPHDVLAAREWGLHAFDKPTQAERDALGPRNCCGIAGALRVALAMQWFPTRRSRRAPEGRPHHAPGRFA